MVCFCAAGFNHLGPMPAMKGIDNPAYYRLVPEHPRYYLDYTGYVAFRVNTAGSDISLVR